MSNEHVHPVFRAILEPLERGSMPEGARSTRCVECGWTYGTHAPECSVLKNHQGAPGDQL